MTNSAETKDKDNVEFLIERLIKECQQKSTGYIGVEYDNLQCDSEISLTEDLFHKIMRELNVLYGNPDEYIRDEYNEDAPFKNQRGVTQHMIRLGKFVHKYAKNYLPEDVANSFIREVEQYINW